MTFEEVVNRLQDRRIDKVMEFTGLSRTTITDIRDGKQNNPTRETLEKLVAYFEERT